MTSVLVLDGPNLDLLGQRQPDVYGSATLEEILLPVRARAAQLGWELAHFQSNHEGALVESVHAARGGCDAIIVNAGALTHCSWALQDALSTFEGRVIEVHISNPLAREPWRHLSVISPVAEGTISGFGGRGYLMALEALASELDGGSSAP